MEIYDCTLREGEQAAGASFSLDDRVELFRLLDEFGVDYIEVGWPVASAEILESFGEIRKIRKNARIVAFGSTSIDKDVEKDRNLKSLIESQADYACIFGKTHLEHVEKQLRISGEENLKRIRDSIEFLIKNKMGVFYDAEHYFTGFKNNKEYALSCLGEAAKAGAERLILCDTTGGMLPSEIEEIVRETRKRLDEKGIKIGLGVHLHDDSGLALANTLASLPYAIQVQGTINGIGERKGNLNFSEFLPIYMNKLGNKLNVDLRKLKRINEEAFRLCGVSVPDSRAFVGDGAFAHKGGVHIDATNKGASYEHENPEDFGNSRVILLNSLGGSAGVVNLAREFGYELDKSDLNVQRKTEELFKELREMERKGYRMGAVKAEQFFLIEKYFGNLNEFFEIEKWRVESVNEHGIDESDFYLRCKIRGEIVEESIKVQGGPVDAAYKAISSLLERNYPEIKNIKLEDFHVGIARRKKEESTVRTIITFSDGEVFQTVGVDNNIIQSAVEALEKGFRYYLNTREINFLNERKLE